MENAAQIKEYILYAQSKTQKYKKLNKPKKVPTKICYMFFFVWWFLIFFLEQTRLLPKLLFVFSVLLVVLHFLPRKKKGENNSKYRIPPDFVLFLVVCFLFLFLEKKTLELSSITKIFFRYLKWRNPHLKLLVTSSGMIMSWEKHVFRWPRFLGASSIYLIYIYIYIYIYLYYRHISTTERIWFESYQMSLFIFLYGLARCNLS